MPNILIYTKDYCPYCTRAKELLKRKGYSDITEIDVTHDAEKLQEMLSKANGQRTVPQIFINGTHVGGFDNMAALDKDGKLDGLLKGQ